jgi:LysM repeat protein
MALRTKGLLLAMLLLTLSGCYRQATDLTEPLNNPTDIPVIQTTSTDANSDSMTVFPATSTFPPVTVVQPATQEATKVPATSAIQTIPTATSAVITPSGPIGPVVIESPTPATPNELITPTPSGLITPTALVNTTDPCLYVVQSGDNLYRIALNHDLSLDEIRAANPDIVGDLIQPGQQINIPNCNVTAVTGDDTTTTDGGSISAITPASVDAGGNRIHTVAAGDTLTSIAQRYGVTVQAIIDANALTNPDQLSLGQQLIIPQ